MGYSNIKLQPYILDFENINIQDIAKVGGKNASLGEMLKSLSSKGINIPTGFASTAQAYWDFIDYNELRTEINLYINNYQEKKLTLEKTGKKIRQLITNAKFPALLETAIINAYEKLGKDSDVAVRSSATAEDLPEASFAGQLESFLNIQGKKELLKAYKSCFASLFTDRAISYREAHGFKHEEIALSVGVQKMVHSDLAGSGVMFTIDTESGFKDSIIINAAWGLGENVVQGNLNPDEYLVFKPLLGQSNYRPIISKRCGDKAIKMIYGSKSNIPTKNIETTKQERQSLVLNDDEILLLAKWGVEIEKHYEKPMDIEWAKDGKNGKLYIVQARPETVQTRKSPNILKTYELSETSNILITGLAIGSAVASGKVQIINSAKEIDHFQEGSILVTQTTDPDWVPIMKKASGIITNSGGRTSHAAIVSRELGLPVIVGTRNATEILKDNQTVTLSCAEGSTGNVYEGNLNFKIEETNLATLPETKVKILINIANPDKCFQWWNLPCKGVGLARIEFIISTFIKIHPMALIDTEKVTDKEEYKLIEELTATYNKKEEYFIEKLAQGIAQIAASQYPNPVIVRMSDFKTNEYAGLIGGKFFEPIETNPMLGFRGASRYYSEEYRQGFSLECKAVKMARELLGLNNIIVMIPFCRTIEEADKVLEVMATEGLKKGENGLQIYVMAEIPSNIILAEEFAQRFDGFSIGSNDLTQLVLGIDRDSEKLSGLFNESNKAIKNMISDLIKRAHACGIPVSFCGQAPSDDPKFAEFLFLEGIDSISLNPDTVLSVLKRLNSFHKSY